MFYSATIILLFFQFSFQIHFLIDSVGKCYFLNSLFPLYKKKKKKEFTRDFICLSTRIRGTHLACYYKRIYPSFLVNICVYSKCIDFNFILVRNNFLSYFCISVYYYHISVIRSCFQMLFSWFALHIKISYLK